MNNIINFSDLQLQSLSKHQTNQDHQITQHKTYLNYTQNKDFTQMNIYLMNPVLRNIIIKPHTRNNQTDKKIRAWMAHSSLVNKGKKIFTRQIKRISQGLMQIQIGKKKIRCQDQEQKAITPNTQFLVFYKETIKRERKRLNSNDSSPETKTIKIFSKRKRISLHQYLFALYLKKLFALKRFVFTFAFDTRQKAINQWLKFDIKYSQNSHENVVKFERNNIKIKQKDIIINKFFNCNTQGKQIFRLIQPVSSCYKYINTLKTKMLCCGNKKDVKNPSVTQKNSSVIKKSVQAVKIYGNDDIVQTNVVPKGFTPMRETNIGRYGLVTKSQNYGQQDTQATTPNLIANVQELDFKLDTDPGVSNTFDLPTYDYQTLLNHNIFANLNSRSNANYDDGNSSRVKL